MSLGHLQEGALSPKLNSKNPIKIKYNFFPIFCLFLNETRGEFQSLLFRS